MTEDKMIYAKDKMCYKCGKKRASKWITVDPDIPPIAYCEDCLFKFEQRLMDVLNGKKETME
jgi:hypothetical protein